MSRISRRLRFTTATEFARCSGFHEMNSVSTFWPIYDAPDSSHMYGPRSDRKNTRPPKRTMVLAAMQPTSGLTPSVSLSIWMSSCDLPVYREMLLFLNMSKLDPTVASPINASSSYVATGDEPPSGEAHVSASPIFDQ